MCGIVGGYNYSGAARDFDTALLRAMCDTMAHRGPDGEGQWIAPDGRVALGHCRLSIIDLSDAGRQPMTNEDGTVWLIFNGEIYNHAALREQLQSAGHRYHSATDSETLIHGYEEWGLLALLERVNGMFAFALWDATTETLSLVRDRVGIKPLYYTFADGWLLYASEIKALLAHPAVTAELNRAALSLYLPLMAVPAPATLFEGIYKLPAGHYLQIRGQGTPRIGQWWDPIFEPPATLPTFEDAAAQVQAILAQSIQDRMIADVPFGVTLSGGIDSSTNVALMARVMTRPVDTYTVGYTERTSHNEMRYARQAADHVNANYHEVLIDHRDLWDFLDGLAFHQDEPLADWVCVPLYFVSRLTRESGTIVAQIGEGADEVFCGYPFFTQVLRFAGRWQPLLQGMPQPVAAGAAALAYGAQRLSGRGAIPARLISRAADRQDLFWGGAVLTDEWQVRQLLDGTQPMALGGDHPSFDGDPLGYELLSGAPGVNDVVRALTARLNQHKPQADLLERMTYLELKHRLPELLLMRVDKMTMANSVEARVPFLDHRLLQYVMPLGQTLKIGEDWVTKKLLKRAVEGVIPDALIYRRKQGFGAPVGRWLREELAGEAAAKIRGSRLWERGIVDRAAVDRLLRPARTNTTRRDGLLWSVLNLAAWYDHWLG